MRGDRASLAEPLEGGAAAGGGGGGALDAAVGDIIGLETPGIGGTGRLALLSEDVEGLEGIEGDLGSSCRCCGGGDWGIGGGGPLMGISLPASSA